MPQKFAVYIMHKNITSNEFIWIKNVPEERKKEKKLKARPDKENKNKRKERERTGKKRQEKKRQTKHWKNMTERVQESYVSQF